MIVDDEPINIEFISLILGEMNIVADSALSGMEALEKIKKRISLVLSGKALMYKLILLDYCMPVMEGPETALEIRQVIGENNIN